MKGQRRNGAELSTVVAKDNIAIAKARDEQYLLRNLNSEYSKSVKNEVDIGDKSIVPVALRKCDGADIIKKNAARKKKYLFSFPGGASFPLGKRIGMLTGLDTTTPSLEIEYPEGRLRLYGKLVFPRNAMLALRGSIGRRKAIPCTDTFDTIVLFSQWAWLGDAASNPGDVAKPLPLSMKKSNEDSIWQDKRRAATCKGLQNKSKRSSQSVLQSQANIAIDTASASEIPSVSQNQDALISSATNTGSSGRIQRSMAGSSQLRQCSLSPSAAKQICSDSESFDGSGIIASNSSAQFSSSPLDTVQNGTGSPHISSEIMSVHDDKNLSMTLNRPVRKSARKITRRTDAVHLSDSAPIDVDNHDSENSEEDDSDIGFKDDSSDDADFTID